MKIKNVFKLLILTILSTLFSLFHINGQTGLPESKHYKLEKLADGIYAAIHNNEGGYAICNAGIIDLGDKTIVIDPFISPAAARDLKQHAEYLTGKTCITGSESGSSQRSHQGKSGICSRCRYYQYSQRP